VTNPIGIDPERVTVVLLRGDTLWTPVSDFVVGEPIFIGAGDSQPEGPWYRFINLDGNYTYGPLSELSAVGVKND
jgi:hypothetical protein